MSQNHSFWSENYTMLFDFYELTMGNGYFNSGKANQISYFDMFFRDIPDGGGFAICAGLDLYRIIAANGEKEKGM